jgi:hypothetical protein
MWCQWHHMHDECGFIDTACKMHTGSLTPHAHKNFRTNLKSENHMHNGDAMEKIFKNACGVNDTPCTIDKWFNRPCSWNGVSMKPHAWFLRLIIDHISAHSTLDSGDQEVLFDEKNPRSKISWYCPFNGLTMTCSTMPIAQYFQHLIMLFFCYKWLKNITLLI